jgi:hypothetical protein
MTLTKEQLCEILALDYADRASKRGASYDASYTHYLERCRNRKLDDLIKQYKVQGLKEKHVQ